MRKIEEQMLSAWYGEKEFSSTNTFIIITRQKVMELYLHHNLIAKKDLKTRKVEITNAGWPSNTTKSRLNCLPYVHIQQKNFEWFLDDKPWDGNWIEIK